MAITFKDVVKLAKGAHSMPALRSVVFDGKSAIVVSELDWVVGVPCPQPAVTSPVVVPVDAILVHLAKSRHLVVTPEHLTNGQGLVTPFNKPAKWDDTDVLRLMPEMPESEAVSFELELDALDRVLIATAGQNDIRYYLRGVLFDLTDGMLVGCDGHRMHTFANRVPEAYPRKVEDGAPVGPQVEVIFGSKPLRWIVGSASPAAKVTIWNALRDGTKPVPALLQTLDGFVWVRNAIEGQYPDWRRVLPTIALRPVWATVNPAIMADTMASVGKLAMLASKNKSEAVTVDFGRCKAYVQAEAEARPLSVVLNSDDADVDLDKVKDGLWAGYSAAQVQDLADCVTLEAQWRLAHGDGANQSLLVVDGDFQGVVMPMRNWEPVRELQGGQPVAVELQEEAEPEPEPCPAAVAAMAAQLGAQAVQKAQEGAKKAPRKAKKAAPVPVAEPVEA